MCFLDTACERNCFELGYVNWFENKHWVDENAEGFDEGIIAWCEIPQFKE